MSNTKARSQEIQAAARALLLEYNVSINETASSRKFAPLLMERTGCGIDTAKRHIAKAQRIARGEYTHAKWGGPRPGAGRPEQETIDKEVSG